MLDERLRGRWVSLKTTTPADGRKLARVLVLKVESERCVMVADLVNNKWATRRLPCVIDGNKIWLGNILQFYILNLDNDKLQLFSQANWTIYDMIKRPEKE